LAGDGEVDKENQPPPPDSIVRVLLPWRDPYGTFQGGEFGVVLINTR